MSEKQTDFRREARDTIVKSGLTGVAATVLAVTLSSPAGLGGMIGTSLASGASADGAANDAYANLPPYPAPLTASEVSEIRGQLAATAASLELTRAATDDTIEQMRDIASAARGSAIAPQGVVAPPTLRGTLAPVEAAATAESTPASYRDVNAAATPTANFEITPVSVSNGEAAIDANLELADLLFSYDSL